MWDGAKACILVEQAPEFELKDGLFRVRIQIGETELPICLQPHEFLKALYRAAEVAEQFDREQRGSNVVEFATAFRLPVIRGAG